MEIIRSIKGTQDTLSPEINEWEFVEQRIKDFSNRFGFHEIRTPIFENTNLFKRSIGELTDVVSKEMYTFEDRGGTSLTLRPEMTASVMRSYIQQNLGMDGGVQKLFYIGAMFRAENVQKGRLRQFHQWGVELIGSPSPLADVEVISLMIQLLKSFGIENLGLKINSVGDENCRPIYKQILIEYLKPQTENLCKTCQGRLEQNPMRVLDCKNDSCKLIIKHAPKLIDHLNEACSIHFEMVKSGLNALQIPFEIDPFLVRGLDYYTKTAFEVVSTDLGSQNAVGGGGRYDLLIEQLGGKSTPSVGFAIGLERLLIILKEKNLLTHILPSGPDLFIGCFKEQDMVDIYPIIYDLRQNGISVEFELLGRSVKAQMREANRLKALYSTVLGDNEINSKVLNLKRMSDGEQYSVPFSGIVSFFKP